MAHLNQHHLAVLGSPISHSRSPRIHQAAYAVLGLPWQYEAIECDVAGLQPLLESRDESWLGFSVTMPLKVEAHRLCDVLDPVAVDSGVVNTLLRLIDRDGRPSWAGFNTDVPGLTAALRDAGINLAHTLVLGAGATAVSAVMAARELGAKHITVAARRLEAANELATRFTSETLACDARSLSEFDSWLTGSVTAVISTLPGTAAASLNLATELTSRPLFDVVYDPWPSPLAERWRSAQGEAHSGISMLVHQALLQLRIFVNGDSTLPLGEEQDLLAAMREASLRV